MSPKELACALGVPVHQVHNWQRRGMPHTKGTAPSIDYDVAVDWLREKKENTKRIDAFNI